MPVQVTPVIFLLNVGAALGMISMFLIFRAHLRLQDKLHGKIITRTDILIICSSVVLTSLFLLWSLGGSIAAYFGSYALFEQDLPPTYLSLLKIEILTDLTQKLIGFLVLSLSSFQNSYVGDKEVLLPWGKSCMAIGFIQTFLSLILINTFHGSNAWLLFYVLSAVIDGLLVCLGILSCILMRKDTNEKGISGYLPKRVSTWNTTVCLKIIIASLLDLFSKTFLVYIDLHRKSVFSLLIDLSCLSKSLSTLLLIHTAYSARIPLTKPYTTGTQ
ncbi:hypothetical protein NEFER03_1542 [Nematocida sp. LUAm3]|nr:hypothetical protein NEFER03_1542 [Nematocida sp. LUAm3]KAI5174575.1 hypothetical protein NEFER02_0696 [Nematocida sp. LUAm2]KAI5178019.1 hypothetical protein NEFER01_1201 [Nematocida sp. LUAm1]